MIPSIATKVLKASCGPQALLSPVLPPTSNSLPTSRIIQPLRPRGRELLKRVLGRGHRARTQRRLSQIEMNPLGAAFAAASAGRLGARFWRQLPKMQL
jgi:hypothetical protein